eukprot:gene9797-biopygen2883
MEGLTEANRMTACLSITVLTVHDFHLRAEVDNKHVEPAAPLKICVLKFFSRKFNSYTEHGENKQPLTTEISGYTDLQTGVRCPEILCRLHRFHHNSVQFLLNSRHEEGVRDSGREHLLVT